MDRLDEGNFREREELHREIIRDSPNPIFLVDVESRKLLDANPALETMLGWAKDDLLNLDLSDIDLGAPAEQDAFVLRVVNEHHDILGERSFRRSDGTIAPVEVSANLLIYQDRPVLCFFARDISEKKEAERESERLRRQLFFSQKHEAVGRLAAGIAHDFNNHLMVMRLCVEIIGDRLNPEDESQEELAELTTAGSRAGSLVRQLLAFSGRQLLRPRLVNFDATLMNLEKMVRRVVGEDIEVVTEYDTGSSTIYADPTQLEQVVLNLVVNSKDAMPDGGRLELTTTEVDLSEDFVRDYVALSPGPHLMLRVTDTGDGIGEDTLQHIFEPFFTTKEQGEGTGLGLATAYGIVKQSGGSIWASSDLGSGSTFRIYLPVVNEEQSEVEHVEASNSEDLEHGTETILLVEDEEMVRVLTSRILRELGYSVLEADGAEEALRALRDAMLRKGPDAIDLVLTDVVMPQTSGPDLVNKLTEIRPELKVIFMSGYSYGKVRAEELVSKNYLCLEKPLTRADLATAVRKTLDH